MAKILTTRNELLSAFSDIPTEKTIGSIGFTPYGEKPMTSAHVASMVKMREICDYTFLIVHYSGQNADDFMPHHAMLNEEDPPVDFIYINNLHYPISIEGRLSVWKDKIELIDKDEIWYSENTDILKNLEGSGNTYSQFWNKIATTQSRYLMAKFTDMFIDIKDAINSRNGRYITFKGDKDIITDLIMVGKYFNGSYTESDTYKIYSVHSECTFPAKRVYISTFRDSDGREVGFKNNFVVKEETIFNQLSSVDISNISIEDLKSYISSIIPSGVGFMVLNPKTGKNATTDDIRNKMSMVIVYCPTNMDESLTSYSPFGEFYWLGKTEQDGFEINYSNGEAVLKQMFTNEVDNIIKSGLTDDQTKAALITYYRNKYGK